jgi:choline kinase
VHRLTKPRKLLLRIYGPQVEHLIDRESELKILQRLARKRIGPRLLGTFTNGRFEEFLHAKALTAQELRQADTSKQIAKRMRELHEGIDLLKEEREAGPFVWQNWDKWVQRCEQVVTWLDQQVKESTQDSTQSPADKWKKRGLVCGVEWPVFRDTVVKYRKWLEDQYGGIDKINERLVFAHNDVSITLLRSKHVNPKLITYDRRNTETSSEWFLRASHHYCYQQISTSNW